ncbi:MAG TPA: uroporphyrinogen decarboxylase [Candidatus Binataceae bacterium]|nr:uroporphyrinogen decarboxylase [Candidatus Binataceae bacterium]
MSTQGAAGIVEDLAGLRVVAFESRMEQETARLIGRYGGRPLLAPAMREVPLEGNPAAEQFARRLLAAELDLVVFLTGVGLEALFALLDHTFDRQALLAALSRVTTVARGPKPAAALRKLGLNPTIHIPEPNTWREVLSAIDQRQPVAGKHVAVQEYGVANIDLVAGLAARGAQVMQVPVYRWALPEDRAPLQKAIAAMIGGQAEVALFTSATQVTHLIQVAEAQADGKALRQALARMAIGSIGPVCSLALRSNQIAVDFEPPHPKLGHLVREAALRAAEVLSRKQSNAVSEVSAAAPAAVPVATSEPPTDRPALLDHTMMRACRRQPTPYTPIWLMRQAGRYMPEYRQVRDKLSFLDMCRRPEVACEVTVTAVRRLGVDAAIIFADILLPLLPLGVGLGYEQGDGPQIQRPVRAAQDLANWQPFDVSELDFVAAAIKLTRQELAGAVPLIGFAGAPFTLASYLIEGGASRQYLATKTMMYTQPQLWDGLMSRLAQITAAYLQMQVAAGADLVQLFDSWVGSLGPDDYRRYVLPYTAAAIAPLRGRVPVIHFGTVTGNLLELMREAGGDIVGLDWRVNLDEAWARLDYQVAVQGNLDPICLFAEIPEIRARAGAILAQAGGRPGHIFNLGHGILPQTPVAHVQALVEMVHEMSQR